MTSRASPVSTIRSTPARRRVRMRCWLTAETASRAGMAMVPSGRSRSLRMRISLPGYHRRLRLSRRARPGRRPGRGRSRRPRKPMGRVRLAKPGRLRSRMRARSSFDRIGLVSLTRRACWGLSASRLPGRADEGHQRHDQLFADGVDGRVGDLGEELLEVPVEQLRMLGEHGQGLVGAHRAHRLVAGGGHGVEDVLEVFSGVAEVALALEEGGWRRGWPGSRPRRARGPRPCSRPPSGDRAGGGPGGS